MASNNSSLGNRSLISSDSDFAIFIKLCLTEMTTLSNRSLDIGHYLVVHHVLSI
jgi:hypothetical protein